MTSESRQIIIIKFLHLWSLQIYLSIFKYFFVSASFLNDHGIFSLPHAPHYKRKGHGTETISKEQQQQQQLMGSTGTIERENKNKCGKTFYLFCTYLNARRTTYGCGWHILLFSSIINYSFFFRFTHFNYLLLLSVALRHRWRALETTQWWAELALHSYMVGGCVLVRACRIGVIIRMNVHHIYTMNACLLFTLSQFDFLL